MHEMIRNVRILQTKKKKYLNQNSVILERYNASMATKYYKEFIRCVQGG